VCVKNTFFDVSSLGGGVMRAGSCLSLCPPTAGFFISVSGPGLTCCGGEGGLHIRYNPALPTSEVIQPQIFRERARPLNAGKQQS